MMKGVLPDFAERLSTAAKAKQALLERAREKANDPKLVRRLEERRAVALAREARIAERQAAKLAEERRRAEEAAAAEAERRRIEEEQRRFEEEQRLADDIERQARQAAIEEARRAMAGTRVLNRKGRLKGKKR
jgi:hypothetical protein